ncbi:MAG: hypothetical protein LBD58_06850 [Treponema sp.]|jgi:hypothetical protein|nr:hypothetical protein [Treponema sp.]
MRTLMCLAKEGHGNTNKHELAVIHRRWKQRVRASEYGEDSGRDVHYAAISSIKKALINKTLEELIKSNTRKGMLKFIDSGVWEGDLKNEGNKMNLIVDSN